MLPAVTAVFAVQKCDSFQFFFALSVQECCRDAVIKVSVGFVLGWASFSAPRIRVAAMVYVFIPFVIIIILLLPVIWIR